MNYITELNRLYRWCMTKKRSKSEIALLQALYMINNAENWADWFEADNGYIQRLTGGLTKKSVIEARNKLKQENRIDLKEGFRNREIAKYMIIPFEVNQKVNQQVNQEVNHIYKQNKTKQNYYNNNAQKSFSELADEMIKRGEI